MMNDAAPPSIHREGRDQSTSSSFLSNISQEDTNRSALRAKGSENNTYFTQIVSKFENCRIH